jgi:hypothetical protein
MGPLTPPNVCDDRAPARAAGRGSNGAAVGRSGRLQGSASLHHLQGRTTTSACVPNTQHVHFSTMYSVVEVVVNSRKVQTPHRLDACIRHWCTDPGFDAQK